MHTKANRQFSTGSVPRAASDAERFVAACREIICREIPGLLDELFSKLDDTLYDLADKSESADLYATYFDAMWVFRQRRFEILSLLLQKLLESGNADVAAGPRNGAGSGSRRFPGHWVSSNADDELEESLAVDNLVSKAENRYRSELTDVRRHLASLTGRVYFDSLGDPLGPYHLCSAFRQALSPVGDVDLSIRLVVYKLFDKQVVDQLGRIYGRWREYAIGKASAPNSFPGKVLPQAGTEDGRADSPRAQGSTLARDSNSASVRGRQAASRGGRATAFHELQLLLGRRRKIDAGDEGQVVLGTDELMSALSRLQGAGGSDADARELRRRLSDYLQLGVGKVSRRALDRADEDTLDLVFLLFEHVLQGNTISAQQKVLIGRLQIPILKVALVDKSFFEDKHHPARRLLNHLAQVAVSWNDDGKRTPSSIYGRIDSVVDQIVGRDDPEPAVFAELDAELCDLLARQQDDARSQELRARQDLARQDPAQQDLELRERQNSARQLVKMAIRARLRGRGPVPEGVASLLFEGWQEVLLAAFLRDGTDGSQWHDAMRIVDRLVWSVQPKVAYEERRELLRSIPELLRTLRERLAEVSYDQRRLARWFKELQALHITALRGAASEPERSDHEARTAVMPVDASPEGVAESAGAPKASDPNAGPSQGYSLETGTWIEVRRDDGGLIRVKLAWRSPQSGIYLFVDRRGRKVLELSGQDILRLESQGTLTVLGDTPIVDRAMQELVQTLRSERLT